MIVTCPAWYISQAMPALRHYQRFWHSPVVWVFVLVVIGGIFSQVRPSLIPSPSSTLQNVSPSTTTPGTPKLHPSCQDDKDVSKVLGSAFMLLRENYIPETKQLECSYQAEIPLRGVSPSIRYLWREDYTPEEWNSLLSELQQQLGFQRLSDQENLVAVHNLVPEVAQTTLFHYADQKLLEVRYTPVDASQAQLVSGATQLLTLIEQP